MPKIKVLPRPLSPGELAELARLKAIEHEAAKQRDTPKARERRQQRQGWNSPAIAFTSQQLLR